MERGIFISYRRSDKALADVLSAHLQDRGVSVWYDGMIAPGQDWRDEIIENIRLAKIILVLFSSDVNTSTELKKELAVADQSDKIIIVVRIENTKPAGGYAYELSNRNWYDAFDNPQVQLREVADYVAKVVKSPDDLDRSFKLSAAELQRRRRLRLYGRAGLLRNNTFLLFAFALSSVAQFFAYNTSVNATGSLVTGGVTPALATVYVALATSLGSPILLLAAIQQKLSGIAWLILPCSLINCSIILLWFRNFASWMVEFRRAKVQ